jgi:hypothetical protein
MSSSNMPSADRLGELSDHELLLLMDLATEVLEGLDQLGLETRAEVEAFVAEIERCIAETE